MRTDRSRVTVLEDLPNVGPAIAADFRRLGIRTPAALKGRDPYALYAALNRVTGQRHDPCVLDTFIAVVRFVDGAPARPWWHYTAERKETLAADARHRYPHRFPWPCRRASEIIARHHIHTPILTEAYRTPAPPGRGVRTFFRIPFASPDPTRRIHARSHHSPPAITRSRPTSSSATPPRRSRSTSARSAPSS